MDNKIIKRETKMEKLFKFIKKYLTKEIILYLVFGVTTTLINWIVTWVLNKFLNVNGSVASAIGIVLAVLFAYFSNRRLVFKSEADGFVENFREFGKFVLGRAFTMILEEGGVILFHQIISLPLMPVKFVLSIIVVILNFIISKFFAFKKKK